MLKGKLNNEDLNIKESTNIVSETNENNESDTVSKTNNKIFQKYSARDIVFLAILSAILILTCSVMAFVAELTKVIFGIAQVVTALQMSLFVCIGLMKVRKVGSVCFMMLFMGAVMVMMSPVMFFSNLFVMIIVELLIIIIFRGYRKNIACFIASMLTAPLSLVVPTVYNIITAPEVTEVTMANGFVVFGMTMAVVGISLVGSTLGLIIGKELDKAGVLKKNEN